MELPLGWRASSVQAGYWRGTEPLFTRALERTDGSSLAHRVLADLRVAQRRIPEAIVHYQTLVSIVPDDRSAHYQEGLERGPGDAPARARPAHSLERLRAAARSPAP